MIKYRVEFEPSLKVERIPVQGEREGFIYFVPSFGGLTGEYRSGAYHSWHDTFEDAQQAGLDWVESQLKMASQDYARRRSLVGEDRAKLKRMTDLAEGKEE